MDMFGSLVEQAQNTLAPHMVTLGDKMRHECERIISRLDAINSNLRDEDFLEYRRRYNVGFTAATAQDIATVPANETWELEVLTIDTAGAITITNGQHGSLLLAKTFAAPDAIANTVVLPGGSTVSATFSVDAHAYIQFKAQRKQPLHNARTAGDIVQAKDQPYMDQSTRRHVGVA